MELDLYGGEAWIAVTPFRIRGQRVRGLPLLPGLSTFPELNVRTYVRHRARPGVYFFSLDAGNRVAVAAARLLYRLPYFFAEMTCEEEGNGIAYRSRRVRGAAELRASYGPVGDVFSTVPGSLEHWLTARFSLFAVHGKALYRADIDHAPWPLQRARAEIPLHTVVEAAGIVIGQEPPLLHFSRSLDVRIGLPGRVAF